VFCSIVKWRICGCLQGHGIDNELHCQVLAIGRDAVLEGRAGSIVLAELVDQVPHDFVQHVGPNSANSVDRSHSVGAGVCLGVGGRASRVRIRANASRRVVDPGTHGVALGASIARLQTDSGRHEVTPALAHAAGLESGQAVGVRWAASKTSGQAISC
jgi:hypothetical protein